MMPGSEKAGGTIRADVQERLVGGSGLVRRLGLLQGIAQKIDGTRSRDEILTIVRTEAKWLLTHQVCLVG